MGHYDRRSSLLGELNLADRVKSLERRVRELEGQPVKIPEPLKPEPSPASDLVLIKAALFGLLERIEALEARRS